MAHGRPWYKRSGGDFVVATMSMPDAETKWAYSAMIDMLNDRDRPLPDEPGFICGFTGLSKRRWAVVRAYLLRHGYLVLADNGRITNPRFERERAERMTEHERSVEAGRLGGKKSAAMRAAGQGELGLENDETPEKVEKKCPKNPSKVGDKLDENDNGRNNSNDLGQAPPQPSRARKRLEDRDSIRPTESSTGPPREAPTQLPHGDLTALLSAVGDACGFHPSPAYPDAFAREIDFVKSWRDAGIDFDQIVIPTIRHMIASTTDPTSSLRRFDRRVRLEYAKAGAKPKQGSRAYQAPEAPILDYPDEPESCKAVRRDLLDRLGPAAFVQLVNPVRFEPVSDAGGNRRPLRIIDNRSGGRLDDGDRHSLVRSIAKRHGFSEVW